MNNFQKILLVLVIIFIPISYLILNRVTKETIIIIPPIKIETTQTRDTSLDTPDTILSNLKVAVDSSSEEVISQEEEAKEILNTLQKSIHVSPLAERVANAITVIKETKKVTSNNKASSQKHLHKRNIVKKHIVKKSKPTKKRVLVKLTKQPIKKKIILKNNTLPKEKVVTKESVVQLQPSSQGSLHPLSREVEVALYKQEHSQSLEIVGESKTFEIKDPTQSIPDEYYFKKHNPKINQPVELNQFVKTLGVVEVSKQYEVKSKISQKVELAKDGVVDISTATVETEELKKLKFVKPLEVTEVSEAFEASKAKKYLP